MNVLPGMPWPFPWPFDRSYMQLALVAGVVVGATAPLIGVFVVHRLGIVAASPAPRLPIGRRLMNSATRVFWMSVSATPPWLRPASDSKMRSGVNCRMLHAVGVPSGDSLRWQP